eukprot:TRINITY_DN2878_c0_g1_i5.p1 TRINITY_DN2878_c0_g1~~TRINITY_DN2878_c0_g1_i5.p1  ORF type:complete len:396 (+),score=24.12 TRINITY_DN2878_c0_g1_i5:126-1313(+)
MALFHQRRMSWLCLCLCLGPLLATTPVAQGCDVTRGPYNNVAPVFKCASCTYITKINLRAGCWLDGIVSFVCSDGQTINVGLGSATGGGPLSIPSSAGFTSAFVGTANWNGNFAGAAVLRFVVPGGFSSTHASVPDCATYTPNVYSTVVGSAGERLIGLQAETGSLGVTRVEFLAGTVTLQPVPTTIPGGVSEFQIVRKGVLLRVESRSPALQASVLKNMVDCFFNSYAAEKSRFNKNAPSLVSLKIDPDYNGIAGAGSAEITVSAAYINAQPLDYGLIAHEAFHVVQSYSKPNAEDIGHWVEGLADYARSLYGCNNPGAGWFLPNDVQPGQYYTDGYGVTARFLVWLAKRVRASIPTKLDSACREGLYTAQFWTALTGRTVQQLWEEYVRAPAL